MLHVLLTVLQVAGLIILTLVIFILVLIASALWVPVRYRIYGEKHDDIYAKVTVSWLLHVISGHIYYDRKGLDYRIKIFGIDFKRFQSLFSKIANMFKSMKNKKKNQKKYNERNKVYNNKSGDNINNNAKTDEQSNQMNVNNDTKDRNTQIDDKSNSVIKDNDLLNNNDLYKSDDNYSNEYENNRSKVNTSNLIEEKSSTKSKNNIKKIIDNIKQYIYKIILKIKGIFNKIINIIKNIKNKFSSFKEFIRKEENKLAFNLVKKQFFILVKELHPRKYKANLHFGTGDPALTGEILGVLGLLMPLYKDNCHIIPDFENVVLEGDIYMIGRIRLFTFVKILWKLYRDKNVKSLYSMITE